MLNLFSKRAVMVSVLGSLLIVLLLFPQNPRGKDNEHLNFSAIPYQQVVRFKAMGQEVESIQVQIFNLAGQKIFDSGVRPGQILDWEKVTDSGERPAYGVYLYVIKAWDGQGNMSSSQVSKMLLLPNETTLSPAPALEQPDSSREDSEGDSEREGESESSKLAPSTTIINEDLEVNGQIYSYESADNLNYVRVEAGPQGPKAGFRFIIHHPDNNGDIGLFSLRGDWEDAVFSVKDVSQGKWKEAFQFKYKQKVFDFRNNQINRVKELGIGTTDPQAPLDVQASSGTNLIRAVDTSGGSADTRFKVTTSGEVYADGSYNCGLSTQDACFNAGSGADVAERINTSEWVEKGDVVEIDPEHPGFFRKARSAYSTRVAGVISTSPGITLGNSFNGEKDKWQDNRPLLALAGRVPVKATTENGSINIGDFLVSSPRPGYVMKCADRTKCIGATIGKALDPLRKGTGVIMIQVMLR